MTFNADGGSAVPEVKQNYNTTIDTFAEPTKAGHTFAGWFIGNDKQNAPYTIKSDVTLVAHWNINQYTVTFNSDGGSAVPEVKQNYNTTINTFAVPTREGYTFDGWYVGEVKQNAPYTITSNVTLVARWTIRQYTVTFNSDGGSAVPEVKQNYNTTINTFVEPTKEGHTFLGWYVGTQKQNAPYTIKGDVTLLAHWAVNRYVVTFNENLGNLVGNNTLEVNFGSNMATSVLPTATKEGYTFVEWRLDGIKYDFSKPIESDITLVAYFKINTYSVKFMVGEEVVETYTVEHGDKVDALPIEPNDDHPELVGVWRLDNVAFDFNQPITGNIILKVHYGTRLTAVVSGSLTNKYVLQFSEDVRFDVEITDKIKFLQSLFLSDFDFNEFNADAITIKYVDKQLIIEIGDNLISNTALKTLSFDEGKGNGIHRVIFRLKPESIRSKTEGMLLYSNIQQYYLKLFVPFADNQADFTKPVTAKFFNYNDMYEDFYNDPMVFYTVKFVSEDIGFEWSVLVGHRDLVVPPGNPQKEGSVFTGWLLDNAIFDFNDRIKTDILLVANWRDAASTVKVTFDSRSPHQIQPQFIEKGTKATLPQPVALDGYEFVEWQLNGTTFNFNSNVSNDITLTAKWKQKLIPITINLNGGAGVSEVRVPYGTEIDMIDLLELAGVPTKVGYLFAGYEQLPQFFDNSFVQVFEPMTVDVIWLPVNMPVKLHYNYDDKVETIALNNDILHTIMMMEVIGINMQQYMVPERPGYLFGGWYATPDFSIPFTDNERLSISLNYYAKWIKIDESEFETYTITFNTMGGSEIDPVEIPVGSLLSHSLMEIPTKDGYQFEDWYLDINCRLPYFTYELPMYYDSDVTLYANWISDSEADPEEESATVTIRFVTNMPFDVDPLQVPKGISISLYDSLWDRYLGYKGGYYFCGWYDELFQRRYDWSWDEVILNEDLTLYAKWEKLNKINFIVDGKVIIVQELSPYYSLANAHLYLFYDFIIERYNLYYDEELTTLLENSPIYNNRVPESLNVYLKEKKSKLGEPKIEYIIHFSEHLTVKIDKLFDFDIAMDEGTFGIFVELGHMFAIGNYLSDGFYLDEELTIKLADCEDTYKDYVVDGKLHIYVKYNEVQYIKVETGLPMTHDMYNVDAITFEPGDTVEDIIEKLEDLNLWKEYHELDGYYLDADYTQPLSEAEDDDITGETVIYVKWEYNEPLILTVSYFDDVLPSHKIVNPWTFDDISYKGYNFYGAFYDKGCLSRIRDGNDLENGQTIYIRLVFVLMIEIYDIEDQLYRTIGTISGSRINQNDLPPIVKDEEMIVGWTLNGEPFDIDQPIISDVALVVLKPIVEPITSYKVEFKINDTIDDELTLNVLKNQSISRCGLNFPEPPFVEEHEFVCWITEDGNEFTGYTKVTQDVILKPLYVAKDDFITISFDTGVEGLNFAPVEIQKYALYLPTYFPTKEGSKFEGWLHQDELMVQSQRFDESTTLVAKWIEHPTCELTFDFGDEYDPLVLHFPENMYIIILDIKLQLMRFGFVIDDHYEILGVTADGNEIGGYFYQIVDDVTIEVNLKDARPVTVTFMVGDNIFRTIDNRWCKNDVFDNEIYRNYPNPPSEDKIFAGWITETGEFVEVGDLVTGDMILKANFVDIEEVNVYFETNVPGLEIEPRSSLKHFPIQVTLQRIAKENHQFLYWSIKGSGERYAKERITEDTTLEAIFEEATTHKLTISFGEEYESIVLDIPESHELYLGALITYYQLNPNYRYGFFGFYDDDGEYLTGTYGTLDVTYDKTIIADWCLNEGVNITFMNGEEIYYGPIDAYRMALIRYYLPEENPSNYPLTFGGWKTEDGELIDDNYRIPGTITLYAHWIDNRPATVSFYAGNVYFRNIQIPRNTCIADHEKLVLRPYPSDSFVNWVTSDGQVFDEYTIVTDNMDVYANWGDNPPATITFMNGENTLGIIDSRWFINDQFDIYLYAYSDLAVSSDPNEIFSHWTYNGEAVDIGSTVEGDMILQACFIQKEEITVTFETNVEGVTMEPRTSYNYVPIQFIPQPLTKENHRFLYWSIKGSDKHLDTVTMRLNGDTILEAIFEEAITHKLTIDFGDGRDPVVLDIPEHPSYNLRQVSNYYQLNPNNIYQFREFYYQGEFIQRLDMTEDRIVTVDWVNSPVVVTFIVDNNRYDTRTIPWNACVNWYLPDAPTDDILTFGGWKTEDGVLIDENFQVTESITLYAHWIDNRPFTVTFMNGDMLYRELEIPKNTSIRNSGSPFPKYMQLQFVGWVTNDGTVFDADTVVTEDITVYADWGENPPVKVTFMVGETVYQIIHDGWFKNDRLGWGFNRVVAPESENDDEIFIYWKLNDEPVDSTYVVQGDMTLVAHFIPKEIIKVTFNANVDGIEPISMNIYKHFVLPQLQTITKENHKFLYWSILGSDEQFDLATRLTEDTILEAIWEEAVTHKLTVDFGDGREPVVLHILENTSVSFLMLARFYQLNPNSIYRFSNIYLDGERITSVAMTEDVKLTVDWEEYVTITFMVDDKVYETRQVIKDKEISYYVNGFNFPNEPVKADHTFIGWETEDGAPFDLEYIPTGNVTVYPLYEMNEPENHTVKFYIDGTLVHEAYVNHGGLVDPYQLLPRDGVAGVWRESGTDYDFYKPVLTDLELHAYYPAKQFTITQNIYGNEYLLTFSEAVVFSADLSDKLAFLQAHFTTTLDYSYVDLDKIDIIYNSDNLELKIFINEDVISSEYFQVLDFDLGNGNGVVRIPFNLKAESIKTEDNLTTTSRLYQYVIKLYVDFDCPNPQPNYEDPIQAVFYEKNYAEYYDAKNDPVLWHTVSFICEETLYEKTVHVKHRQKVGRAQEPIRDNYIFVEWQLDGEKFDFNTEIKSNITLTPRWADAQTMVRVSFDTQSPHYIEPQIIEKGGIPVMPETMTLAEFDFVGWQYNDADYNFDTAIQENIVLVAVWKPKLVTVTINLNGGEGETEILWPYGHNFSAVYLLHHMQEYPTKEGYLFGGFQQLNDDPIRLYEPITLDVVWLESNMTITFDYGYEDKREIVEIAGDIAYMAYILPHSVIDEFLHFPPERENYIFGGWYTDPELTIPYMVNNSVVMSFNYYAKWIPIEGEVPKYTITFNTNGGNAIAPVQVKVGDYLDLYEFIPTKEGFQFLGWFVDSEFKLPYVGYPPYYYDSDLTLYAKWHDISSGEFVTVSFVTNSPFKLNPVLVPKGEAIYLFQYVTDIMLNDYNFVGWFNATYENEYDLFTLYEFNEDITLHALWEKRISLSLYCGDQLVLNNYLINKIPLANVLIPWFILDKYELYLDEELTNELFSSAEYYEFITEDLIIYLKEKVHVDLPDIEYYLVLNDEVTVTINQQYGVELDEDTLGFLGHIFIFENRMANGLYYDPALTQLATADNYLDYVTDGKLYLYMDWKDVEFVKFVTNTNIIDFYGNLDVIVIEPGDTFEDVGYKVEDLRLEKYGYQIAGFYFDADFTQNIEETIETVEELNGRTIYVKWEKIPVVTIDTAEELPLHKILVTDGFPDLYYEEYAITAISYDEDYISEVDIYDPEIIDGQTIYLKLVKLYNVVVYQDDDTIWDEYDVAEGAILRDEYELPVYFGGDEMVVGWTLNGEVFDVSQPFTCDTTFAILKPVWGPVSYVKVQFSIDGEIDEDLSEDMVPNTRFYWLPYAPYKEGYEFVYWQTEAGIEFTTKTYVTEAMTLYAVYVSEDDYITISYVTNVPGVTIPDDTLLRYSYADYIPLYNLTKSGHKFHCLTYEDGTKIDLEARLTEDVTIVFNWIPTTTYRVRLLFNLGLGPKNLYIPENKLIYLSFWDLLAHYYGILDDFELYEDATFMIDGVNVTDDYYKVTSDITIQVTLQTWD